MLAPKNNLNSMLSVTLTTLFQENALAFYCSEGHILDT